LRGKPRSAKIKEYRSALTDLRYNPFSVFPVNPPCRPAPAMSELHLNLRFNRLSAGGAVVIKVALGGQFGCR
jgi:hypothetical protein